MLMNRRRFLLASASVLPLPAAAQNSFLTPGGASVPGIVTMCLSGNVAVPCSASAFPPTANGAQADAAANFASGQYWASAATQASFAAWVTALGGSFARTSSATYLQGGVLKTATANTPRFPTDLAGTPQGIRLTGPATNLLLQSNAFGTAPWGLSGTATQTTDGPDGVANSAWVVAGNVGGSGTLSQILGAGSLTGSPQTVSWFARPGTSPTFHIQIVDQTTAATIWQALFTWATPGSPPTLSSVTGAATLIMTQLANGWWRFDATFTGTATDTFRFLFYPQNTSGSNTGVNTHLFGAQLASLPFGPDYIPTTTVTVAQGVDNLQYPFTQTTFSTLAVTNQLAFNTSSLMAFVGNQTNNIAIGSNSAAIQAYMRNNSVSPLLGPLYTLPANQHKFMGAGSNAGRSLTVDAAVPISDAVALVPAAPTALGIGSVAGGTFAMYGNMSQFAAWNGIVASAAEMQRLTT